jgi:hypothetical protein
MGKVIDGFEYSTNAHASALKIREHLIEQGFGRAGYSTKAGQLIEEIFFKQGLKVEISYQYNWTRPKRVYDED